MNEEVEENVLPIWKLLSVKWSTKLGDDPVTENPRGEKKHVISRTEGKRTMGKVCRALDLKCPVKLLRGDGTFKGWDPHGRSWLSECTGLPFSIYVFAFWLQVSFVTWTHLTVL